MSHANEIVLLSYYIAAINIEETFHSMGGDYKPFEGIVLTDTFGRVLEKEDSFEDELFAEITSALRNNV